MAEKERSIESKLVDATLIVVVLYNLLFFWGKFGSHILSSVITPIYESIQSSIGFLTIMEIIGVVVVFADLMLRLDSFSSAGRKLRYVFIAIALIGFFFKLFINYLDSALG
ncbi:MAG: hypothetical protein MK081_08275 [Flavobacteriales bacterium]|uniref:hypothetical protein n=1 Tax=Sanyastnella coralliicola TaxID=3069118 RepID=UPI0027B9BC95|nr:hypothetical protein [Longitalea sp. SCSIO 12813]MCH2198767.1 hypothetical protein [Flavobacteriales bacterium]